MNISVFGTLLRCADFTFRQRSRRAAEFSFNLERRVYWRCSINPSPLSPVRTTFWHFFRLTSAGRKVWWKLKEEFYPIRKILPRSKTFFPRFIVNGGESKLRNTQAKYKNSRFVNRDLYLMSKYDKHERNVEIEFIQSSENYCCSKKSRKKINK